MQSDRLVVCNPGRVTCPTTGQAASGRSPSLHRFRKLAGGNGPKLGTIPRQALKLSPQEQLLAALGFRTLNPASLRAST